MDMKKKLDEKYLPDKEARKSRVVVGLSGGLNSFVMAYLLKIQKYDLVAVTVLMNWDENKTDNSKILSCDLDSNKLTSIKEFCHQLGIAHHVIQASDEFKDEVVERWTTSRITGTKSNQCWNCHELRMKLLHRKMVELRAEELATGHLAKIFRQESHHSVYVHTSNDELNDQSALLSRLPHKILDKLMLPLSDLQQKEINKLAENFGLNSLPKTLDMHSCFNIPYSEGGFLDKTVPAKILRPGEVVDLEKSNIGDHLGIHHYKYGEVFPLPHQNAKLPLHLVKYSYFEKKIEVQSPEYFQRDNFFLRDCKISEDTSLAEPLRGVLKVGEADYVDCWIYPKNFFSSHIVLDSAHRILEGEIVVILKKRGKNAKVYLTGKVQYIPKTKSEPEEGRKTPKTDYSVDF
jgi:tRNA U34 2-thiouridine synthase MnmA/TrmU